MENTWNAIQKYGWNKDHLHLRGEYGYEESTHRPTLGSSPLTWRILLNPLDEMTGCRIISTYVENTIRPNSDNQNAEDHLHLRGEY